MCLCENLVSSRRTCICDELALFLKSLINTNSLTALLEATSYRTDFKNKVKSNHNAFFFGNVSPIKCGAQKTRNF